MTSANSRGPRKRTSAREPRDPILVHLRRKLNALCTEVHAHLADQAGQVQVRRPEPELRQRWKELDTALVQLMEELTRHQRYVEDPDDPSIRRCANLHAQAKGCLRALRRASRKIDRLPASPGQDALRERYRSAAELDQATREEQCSVRTVSGGLPTLGKRR